VVRAKDALPVPDAVRSGTGVSARRRSRVCGEPYPLRLAYQMPYKLLEAARHRTQPRTTRVYSAAETNGARHIFMSPRVDAAAVQDRREVEISTIVSSTRRESRARESTGNSYMLLSPTARIRVGHACSLRYG
jgi:hypothetical protein